MNIKRYELKPGVTPEQIKAAAKLAGCRTGSGGTWINPYAAFYISYPIGETPGYISADIAFPEDLSQWNDYDHVLVIDEDFCQLYTPFYEAMRNKEIHFSYLDGVIESYNRLMDNLGIFQEVTN